MIKRLSHAGVPVLDQDSAKAFYTDKLGFEVRTDVTMDGFRWLTVSLHDQPDLEFILLRPGPPMHDEETGAQIRALVAKGAIGGGVWETDDCKATYDELSAKGVQFPTGAGRAAVRHRGGVPGRLGELVQPHAADRRLTSRPNILGLPFGNHEI
jgi:catechol 2,3-dioxygenase-like lactoylglutathione lyase family enzyme